jgi:hypothetical protein
VQSLFYFELVLLSLLVLIWYMLQAGFGTRLYILRKSEMRGHSFIGSVQESDEAQDFSGVHPHR